jgi:hypothetical protein
MNNTNSIFVGYITMLQAVTYCGDQKLAIYMKVPYRTIFWAQLWASVASSFTQVGALTWMFNSIKDLCTSEQKNHFTCPNGRVFFNASIIWGVIGPQRVSHFLMEISAVWLLTILRCSEKEVSTPIFTTFGLLAELLR